MPENKPSHNCLSALTEQKNVDSDLVVCKRLLLFCVCMFQWGGGTNTHKCSMLLNFRGFFFSSRAHSCNVWLLAGVYLSGTPRLTGDSAVPLQTLFVWHRLRHVRLPPTPHTFFIIGSSKGSPEMCIQEAEISILVKL